MSTKDEKKKDKDKEDLANARRKLKKFRDQHPNGNGPAPSLPVAAVAETDDPLHLHLHLPFEQFLLQRTFSPFDIGDDSSPIPSADSARRPVDPTAEQSELHVQTIGILVAEKADLSAKLSQSLKQLERKQGEIDELFGRLKASRERIEQLEKDFLNSTSGIQKRELSAKESEKENIQLKLENIRLSQMIEDLKLKSEEKASSSSSTTRDQRQIDELKQELEKLRESSSRSSTQCRETIDRLEEEKSDLLGRVQRLDSSVAEEVPSESSSSVDADGLRRCKEENDSLKQRLAEQDHLILQLQCETDTIGDYIRLYQEQRQQLQKRAEENDLLQRQLSEERRRLQMKESLIDEFLLGLAVRLSVDGEELRRIFASFVDARRQGGAAGGEDTSVGPNGDGRTEREAFVGDQVSHQCSTCRGLVQRI